MYLCERCGEEVVCEPCCFVCSCGLSFAFEVLERIDDVAVVRSEVGMPFSTAAFVVIPRSDRMVA